MRAAARAARSAPCAVPDPSTRDLRLDRQARSHFIMNTVTPEATRTTTTPIAPNHPVVPADRWVAERKALLAREKELVQLRDEIARARRDLPWERVAKGYA